MTTPTTPVLPPAGLSEEYALTPSALPVANSTESFWLSERSRLDRHRTTEDLPSTADVLVIGSGLSGAMVAYELLRQRPTLKVVMLEAREVCSGASARNGGQVKTDPYITYRARKARFGAHAANELIKFETNHLAMYEALLEEEQIPCSLHVTTAFDVCLTEPMAKLARDSYRERMADWPKDTSAFRELADPEELQRLSGVKGGIWGTMYRVASIWPYKLATGLLERCFTMANRGGGSFNLQTTTPALSIDATPTGFTATTERGNICTDNVVVCTNGYTSHLVPEMTYKIVPIRGTVASLIPPRAQLANTPTSQVFRQLFTSFAFKFGGGHGEYMISRQDGKKEIIIGGAKQGYLQNVPLWYGNTDDSQQLPGAFDHFKSYMPKLFVNWPDPTSNVDRVWTGIMGYSSDKFPWVGQVPFKRDGFYIMAGFHGHGMCRIPGSAKALSRLILSGSRGQDGLDVMSKAGLPLPYMFTPERFKSNEFAILDSMGYKPPPKSVV